MWFCLLHVGWFEKLRPLFWKKHFANSRFCCNACWENSLRFVPNSETYIRWPNNNPLLWSTQTLQVCPSVLFCPQWNFYLSLQQKNSATGFKVCSLIIFWVWLVSRWNNNVHIRAQSDNTSEFFIACLCTLNRNFWQQMLVTTASPEDTLMWIPSVVTGPHRVGFMHGILIAPKHQNHKNTKTGKILNPRPLLRTQFLG